MASSSQIIPLSFYQASDVVALGKALLGKLLMTRIEGHLTGGYILETESYAGVSDRASHAYNHKRTARTEVMYQSGGRAYVYLCYGMHCLFNVVTASEGEPHAVLIRALLPAIGLETMWQRRKKKPLTAGPGTLCAALGITLKQNGKLLDSEEIWIEEGVPVHSITAAPRIGIDYAGPDAFLPYRFIGELDIIKI